MRTNQNCLDISYAKPVALVHGIGDTAALFNPLRLRLQLAGYSVLDLDLIPNNGDAGLEELAAQVARHVNASLCEEQPLDIVGFSMGGLVSRYYVQHLAKRRIGRLITVSTPHRGTWTAYLRNNTGARQMRPGSQFLEHLNAPDQPQRADSFTSIWTPLDLMIVPSNSSLVKVAKSIPVYVAAHALMMRDSRVLLHIERELLS